MTDFLNVLSGVRVLELGVWVAGPAAAATLSDWGANVIKVEPPTGDPQRGVFRALGLKDGRVPPFEQDNRGKQSLILNLQEDGDYQKLLALLEATDVLITNMRPAALNKLKLNAESLLEQFPRLIYGRLTGYGAEGPDVNRAGYDVGGFWSRAGLPTRIVPPDQPPPNIPPGFGDHMTATSLVSGVVAALFNRERTGKGMLVDTSLLRTGIYGLSADISMQKFFGKVVPRTKREKAEAPMVNCYKAKDDKWIWMLAVESTRHWPNLLRALDKQDLEQDPRFSDARARYKHKVELVDILDKAISEYNRDALAERFDLHDVWWAPVQTLDEVVADPQAIAAGAFIDIPGNDDEPEIGGAASPVSFGGTHPKPQGAAPELGQHTDEILTDLERGGSGFPERD